MNDPELTLSVIEDLKRQGYTQSDIARMFGVTRQAVSWHKQTYNGRLTPREEVLKHFPWDVPALMAQTGPYRYMRDHAEYMATGGKGMGKVKLERCRALYRKISQGLVLEFDPGIPVTPGVSNTGGFAWRERRPTDGDLIIRVNDHTTLTDEGKLLWRLPPTLP
jgi:DNA-binding XRE family transcriptional regulator